MAKPPSMVDVARMAGVAHVTVSRVLNEPDTVRPETRQRVQAAIEELGYRRNSAARALRSGKTAALGLIIAGSELFQLGRIMFGMETALDGLPYGMNLARWQGQQTEPIAAAVERLAERGADGVLVIADRPVAAEALDELRTDVPVSVIMSGRLNNPTLATVEIDQDHGVRKVAQHLVELGHQDLLHLAGDLAIHDARARLDSWRTVVAQSGTDEVAYLEGDFSAASGYELGLHIAGLQQRPTGIFAANDAMAQGVLAGFAQAGIRVPEDLSLVGFDDVVNAAYLVPALTTVRQDHFELGRRGMEVLLGLLQGEEARHHLIEPTLVIRRSTAPRRLTKPGATVIL